MTTRTKTVDWGGLTVIANALYLGASKPQSAGTLFSTAGTVTTTGTITAGGPASTGAGSAAIFRMNTAETTVVALDQLGRIEFAAPLEASGTDSILVSASIWAEAEGTFTASVNTTAIVFATGASETAAEKARITSTGGWVTTAPVVTTDAATYTVLATNSGRVHVVPDLGQSCTFTLPAAVAGLNYEFWYGGAATEASDWLIVPTAGFFIGGVNHQDTDGETTAPVYSDGNSNDNFTVIKPETGTQVFFRSDGTNWYVNGTVCSVTVPTMAD
jgi:hypothetical protein